MVQFLLNMFWKVYDILRVPITIELGSIGVNLDKARKKRRVKKNRRNLDLSKLKKRHS